MLTDHWKITNELKPDKKNIKDFHGGFVKKICENFVPQIPTLNSGVPWSTHYTKNHAAFPLFRVIFGKPVDVKAETHFGLTSDFSVPSLVPGNRGVSNFFRN